MGVTKKLVTPEMRLSYTHLLEPRAIEEGADPRYSVSIIIPKTEKKFIKQVNDIINELIDKNQEILKTKKNIVTPLRDGDEDRPDDPTYTDAMFLSVSAKQKPIVVDVDRNEILESREIYSGMYGRVSINFFAYNKAGKKGISAALNAVQKTKDGDPLGGTYTRSQMEDDFGDDSKSNSGEDDDLLG